MVLKKVDREKAPLLTRLSRYKKPLLYTVMILIAIGQLFPLVWLINYSLLRSGELFGAQFIKWPDIPMWSNYVRAWIQGNIPRYFLNSIIVVCSSVLLTVICSFLLAYACTRMEWKLRSTVYGLVLLGMTIPIHATLLPNFMLFNRVGILDTYWGLIIPYTAFSLPFSTLIFSGFLSSFPRTFEESAMIDGCSMWGILARIIAPNTKPAVITVAIMAFVNNWNDFIMANTYISTQSLLTLPFSVIKFMGEYSGDYAAQFACMVFAAFPTLFLYAFLNKYITEGVTMTGIKG